MKYFKLGRKPFAVLTLVCFLLLPMVVGNVLAAPMKDKLIKEPAEIAKTITGEKADELANKAMLLDEFKAISSKYTMDNAHINVKQLSKIYGNRYAVGIPIKDNTGFNISNFIVIFNSEGKFEGTQLMVYQKTNDGTYHFMGNMDKVQIEMDVTETGELLGGYALYENGNKVDIKTLVSTKGMSEWWSCMNKCMFNIGVPGWIITLVGTACAVACAVTAGAGCVACVLGLEFLTAFDVGACIAQCAGWGN